MSKILQNVLAGIGTFPVIVTLILGIGLASGVNTHLLLIPIIITNLVSVIYEREALSFYNISVGLAVFTFLIISEGIININEPSLATLVMLLIPGLLFMAMSFLPIKFRIVPTSTVTTVSLGIGVVVILKQLPYALGIDLSLGDDSTLLDKLVSLNGYNWLQLGLAILIPIIPRIGKKRFGQYPLLLLGFVTISLIGYFLPSEKNLFELQDFQLDAVFIQNWSLTILELKTALSYGLTIFIISLCNFSGDYSTISTYRNTEGAKVKKSLRVLGAGNIISAFFGVVPTNIGMIESITLSENKATNKISIYTILILLVVCLLIKVPSFYFPLFPLAGLLFHVGSVLVSHAFMVLKQKTAMHYVIGILGGICILFVDYITGFIFSLICSIIHEVYLSNSKPKSK